MKKALLFSAIATISTTAIAEEKLAWKGNALGTLRYSASHDFQESTTTGQLRRAYIGYKAKYGKTYEAGVIYDSKYSSASGVATPFLKNAFIKFKNDNFDVTTGIQSAISYKGSLSIWNLLYIRYPLSNTWIGGGNKSKFRGEEPSNNFSSFDGADLGVLAHSNIDGLDIYGGVFQGNGYKNLSDNLENERYVFAINRKNKNGLNASFYTDIRPYFRDSDTDSDLRTLAHLGYSQKSFKLGYEAAFRSVGGEETNIGEEIYAFASNLRFFPMKKLSQFNRFEVKMNQDIDSDEYYGITGFEYYPIPKFKLAAYYNGKFDTDDQYKQYVGVGTEIKF